MACRLFGAKLLPEPMLYCFQLYHWEQNSVKFESIYKTFDYENAFENIICEMMVILSRGRWAKWYVTALQKRDEIAVTSMQSSGFPLQGWSILSHSLFQSELESHADVWNRVNGAPPIKHTNRWV